MGIFSSAPSKKYELPPIPPAQPIPKDKRVIGKDNAKLVLCYRYIGTGYHGLQLNLDTKTIEKDLFEGLIKSGLLPDKAYMNLGKINWSEASRTDSGVHTCAQVLSFNSPNSKGFVVGEIPELINRALPKGSPIEIIYCLQFEKPFYAQRFADARDYNYLLPLHTFKYQSKSHLNYLRNKIMSLFIGTKSFHNFTTNMPPNHKSAIHTITEFTFTDPFIVDDEEFVLFSIKGNSFMLNQIRNMIGAVISASYEQIGPEEIRKLFTEEEWYIKTLPGDGLMLDKVHYTPFMKPTNKYPVMTPDRDVEFTVLRPEIEKWKREVLFHHIARLVREKDIFRVWVRDELSHKPVAPKKYLKYATK